MFKGTIRVGTAVEARLTLDATASATALLFIGFGSSAGGRSDSVAVAPGGSGTVRVTATERGILRVLVDLSADSDAGRLLVRPATPEEAIRGDTAWGYVVA